MKNRQVGFLVIGIAVVFFLVVMSFNNALDTIVNTTCTHGEMCPMHITLKTQKAVSYSLIGLLIGVGAFVSFLMKDETIIREVKESNKRELSEEDKKNKLNDLEGPEKEVMNIILKEDGSVYQSDIVKETSQSKVKVTRVLDRLEGKGLIERKRRGMTNVVVLK